MSAYPPGLHVSFALSGHPTPSRCYLRRRSGLQLKGDLFGVIELIVAYKS